MSVTKVGAIIWTTARVQELIEFYRVIGIPLDKDTHDEPDHTPHFEGDIAGTHFAIFEKKDADTTLQAHGTMIGLAVENLKDVFAKLSTMGVKIKTPMENTPWGKRFVVFDPDGRAVEIFEPPS